MKLSSPSLLPAALALVLAACTPEAEQSSAPAVVETSSRIVDRKAPIEALMNLEFMPNADRIWRAVSYVANEQGITETMPETDEDWAILRDSANALIAASDTLLDTDRDIYDDFDTSTASFQFTPDEVQQLLAEDPQAWEAYIERMQENTRMTLQAIELRDLTGLVDFGARINEACEGCHAAYWYRPPQELAPR